MLFWFWFDCFAQLIFIILWSCSTSVWQLWALHSQTWFNWMSEAYQSLPPRSETCQENTKICQLCFRRILRSVQSLMHPYAAQCTRCSACFALLHYTHAPSSLRLHLCACESLYQHLTSWALAMRLLSSFRPLLFAHSASVSWNGHPEAPSDDSMGCKVASFSKWTVFREKGSGGGGQRSVETGHKLRARVAHLAAYVRVCLCATVCVLSRVASVVGGHHGSVVRQTTSGHSGPSDTHHTPKYTHTHFYSLASKQMLDRVSSKCSG